MREYDKVMATAEAMRQKGSRFVRALGTALRVANPGEREKLHIAFRVEWDHYRTIAEKKNWYMEE